MKSLQQLIIRFLDFLSHHKILVLTVLILTILSYGFELSHFTLSIDEEYGILDGIGANGWLAQSRYTTGLLKLITNSSKVVPYFSTFLCIFTLYAATLFWAFLINDFLPAFLSQSKRICSLLVFATLIISSPVNAFFVAFSTYNFEVSLGVLLTGIATYFATQFIFTVKQKPSFYLSCIFLVLAAGIYQSFFILFVFGVVLSWFCNIYFNQQIFTWKKIFLFFLKILLICVCSVVSYYFINKIVQFFIPPSDYLGVFWQWPQKTLMQFITETRNFFYDIVVNYQFVFGKLWLLSVLTSSVIFINIFFHRLINKFLLWALALFIIMAPILMNIALGFNMPLRSNQTLIFSIAAIWFLVIITCNIKWFRTVCFLIVVYICFLQSRELNKFFYTDYARYQRDITFAEQINSQLETLDPDHQTSIYFVGKKENVLDFRQYKYETLGYSFFEWDNGNNSRMRAFLETCGYKWKLIPKDQWPEAENFAANLSSYPEPGFVQATESGIVIKLSESTYVDPN